MRAAGEWLTSIVMVTALLGMARQLLPEGALRQIGSFTGGLILILAILGPLPEVDLGRIGTDLEAYSRAIQEQSEALAADSSRELAGLIEERTAAYISEQVQRMGLRTAVRVRTKTDREGVPVPVEVELTGEQSEALSAWIEAELGIPAERQAWNDEH